MYCKSIKSKKYWTGLTIIGVITIIFAQICENLFPSNADNFNMLMGMFSGLGVAFSAVGVIKLIHYRRTPEEKLKQEEINRKDERNVEILRISGTVSNGASSILFAVIAFVFVFLNYKIPAIICIAALYVQILVFLISYGYYNKKM